MASLNAEHINPFLVAAKRVLQEACFLEVNIQKPMLKETDFNASDWVIIVGLTGEMRGQVLLYMTQENACTIASKMCMMEITEINELAASALSELGNMIMGNAATVFSSNGVGIDITPPKLEHGQGHAKKSTKNLCIPMEFKTGGGIEMFLAIHQQAAG